MKKDAKVIVTDNISGAEKAYPFPGGLESGEIAKFVTVKYLEELRAGLLKDESHPNLSFTLEGYGGYDPNIPSPRMDLDDGNRRMVFTYPTAVRPLSYPDGTDEFRDRVNFTFREFRTLIDCISPDKLQMGPFRTLSLKAGDPMHNSLGEMSFGEWVKWVGLSRDLTLVNAYSVVRGEDSRGNVRWYLADFDETVDVIEGRVKGKAYIAKGEGLERMEAEARGNGKIFQLWDSPKGGLDTSSTVLTVRDAGFGMEVNIWSEEDRKGYEAAKEYWKIEQRMRRESDVSRNMTERYSDREVYAHEVKEGTYVYQVGQIDSYGVERYDRVSVGVCNRRGDTLIMPKYGKIDFREDRFVCLLKGTGGERFDVYDSSCHKVRGNVKREDVGKALDEGKGKGKSL